MNRLPLDRQIAVIAALTEGNSIRSAVRMTGVAKNTITKLLGELGPVCAGYMDRTLRDLAWEPHHQYCVVAGCLTAQPAKSDGHHPGNAAHRHQSDGNQRGDDQPSGHAHGGTGRFFAECTRCHPTGHDCDFFEHEKGRRTSSRIEGELNSHERFSTVRKQVSLPDSAGATGEKSG